MSDNGQGSGLPYEIKAKCIVGEDECAPGDVVCLSDNEYAFLLANEAVFEGPSFKDLTRRRPESSGCASCGASR